MNNSASSHILDPRDMIAQRRMGSRQKIAIALCLLLTIIDGYDILSIGFSAPAISAEWGIDKSVLGLILSVELFGMGIGAVLLGRLADLIGRRPTIIACLVLIAMGMAAAGFASGVWSLSLARLLAGLGIGGVAAATSAVASELSNIKSKAMAVTLMASGVPIGGLLGGTIAGHFVVAGQWHMVFLIGGAMTAAMIPLCLIFLPETPAYLMQQRGDEGQRLARMNRALDRLGHGSLEALPTDQFEPPRHLYRAIVAGGYRLIAAVLILTNFLHLLTSYFALKWIPKIAVDLGHSMADGIALLFWVNAAGLAGCLIISVASLRWDNRILVPVSLLFTGVGVALFGQVSNDLATLKVIAAVIGFFLSAGVVGCYGIIAQSFPGYLRGGGAGAVIGFGRVGAVAGPMVAGLLLSAGIGLSTVVALAGMGSILGGIALLSIRKNPKQIH